MKSVLTLIGRPSLSWDESDYRQRMEASIRKAWPNQEIDLHQLIFHEEPDGTSESGRKLTIFIDRAIDLDWLVHPNTGESANNELSKITAVSSIPCKHLPEEEQIAFRQMLGAAVSCAISGNFEEADKQRLAAKEFIERRITERSRSWSLTFAFLLLMMLAATIAMSGDSPFSLRLNQLGLAGSMTLGCVGAYVSIVYGSSRDKRDSSSGKWLHFVEVVSKFSVGALGGMLSGLLLASSFSPQVLHNVPLEPNAALVFGFIAGFSEKFIPRIVSNYEPQKEPKKT